MDDLSLGMGLGQPFGSRCVQRMADVSIGIV